MKMATNHSLQRNAVRLLVHRDLLLRLKGALATGRLGMCIGNKSVVVRARGSLVDVLRAAIKTL